MTEKVCLKVARVSTASATYQEFFNQLVSGKGVCHLIISILPDATALTYGLVKIRIGDDTNIVDLKLEGGITIEYPRLDRGIYERPRQGETVSVHYKSDGTNTSAFNMLVQYSQVKE